MGSKKQSAEPSLRTIVEKIEDLRGRFDSHDEALGDLRVRVDSQSVVLEDMRSQNRLTIEAVEALRSALEQRIERLDQGSRSRDALLELAIRDLKVSVQENTLDIRDLAGKVEALSRLEHQVAAIERRLP
jgi:chromosome segregation ATPase